MGRQRIRKREVEGLEYTVLEVLGEYTVDVKVKFTLR